jgi:hypothetical protein
MDTDAIILYMMGNFQGESILQVKSRSPEYDYESRVLGMLNSSTNGRFINDFGQVKLSSEGYILDPRTGEQTMWKPSDYDYNAEMFANTGMTTAEMRASIKEELDWEKSQNQSNQEKPKQDSPEVLGTLNSLPVQLPDSQEVVDSLERKMNNEEEELIRCYKNLGIEPPDHLSSVQVSALGNKVETVMATKGVEVENLSNADEGLAGDRSDLEVATNYQESLNGPLEEFVLITKEPEKQFFFSSLIRDVIPIALVQRVNGSYYSERIDHSLEYVPSSSDEVNQFILAEVFGDPDHNVHDSTQGQEHSKNFSNGIFFDFDKVTFFPDGFYGDYKNLETSSRQFFGKLITKREEQGKLVEIMTKLVKFTNTLKTQPELFVSLLRESRSFGNEWQNWDSEDVASIITALIKKSEVVVNVMSEYLLGKNMN